MSTLITVDPYPTGVTDLYAYYRSQSLANYVANKVLFVEKPSPDLGLYEATVDESKGTDIRAFRGATQPASWEDAITGLSWNLAPTDAASIIAAIKADADLGTASGGMVANAATAATQATAAALDASKIPRAAAAVTAGAPQAKHLENSLGATLQSVREVFDGDAS